jgi:hypothetical protein
LKNADDSTFPIHHSQQLKDCTNDRILQLHLRGVHLYIKSPINFLQRTLWLHNCRLRIYQPLRDYCINRHRSERQIWTSVWLRLGLPANSHMYVECKNHCKKIVRAVKAGRASERVLWF